MGTKLIPHECKVCGETVEESCNGYRTAAMTRCPALIKKIATEGPGEIIGTKADVMLTDEIDSGGGSASYYELPEGASELGDLIEHKEMDFNTGNIFKACYRIGEKNDPLYEADKIIWFGHRLRNHILRKRDLI